MPSRVMMARRFFRIVAVLWAGFMVAGYIFRLPYLSSSAGIFTWEVSIGGLGLLLDSLYLWTGTISGTRGPFIHRSTRPVAYWSQLALLALLSIGLIGAGLFRLRQGS